MRPNKKAQIGNLPSSIVMLGIAAISLVLLLVILVEMRDIDTLTTALSSSADNETASDPAAGAVTRTLTYSTLPAVVCSIGIVTNATGGETIPSSNYTASGCSLLEVADGIYNETDWNVSYTYTYGDTAYVQSNETIVGLTTFSDFWTIIVLAIIAGVVIGIIFSAFGSAGRPR